MLKQVIATSDASNTGFVVGALVISGIILVGYLVYFLVKKNKKNK